jgi:hypothetical protein
VVPGSLLLLAILMYRQPFLAGLFLGLAAGVVYYPFFLLPLWCSFYWQRGVRRFALGFIFSVAMLILAIALSRQGDFLVNLGYMFGIKQVEMRELGGIWGLGWHPLVRIPIIVVFVILTIFRPNLDYCVALEVVRPWRRKAKLPLKEERESPPMVAA